MAGRQRSFRWSYTFETVASIGNVCVRWSDRVNIHARRSPRETRFGNRQSLSRKPLKTGFPREWFLRMGFAAIVPAKFSLPTVLFVKFSNERVEASHLNIIRLEQFFETLSCFRVLRAQPVVDLNESIDKVLIASGDRGSNDRTWRAMAQGVIARKIVPKRFPNIGRDRSMQSA